MFNKICFGYLLPEEVYLSPPRTALLKLSTVKKVADRKMKHVWVVQPQGYNSVTKLQCNDTHFEDRRYDDKNNVGLFHTGKSRVAQTGDGGDGGDKWWIVNDSLIDYLLKTEVRINNILKQ